MNKDLPNIDLKQLEPIDFDGLAKSSEVYQRPRV
jgi:hypothetical protein